MTHRSVLVTGANGFIARQLIVNMLSRGHRVRGTLRSLERADSLKAILSQYAPIEKLSFVAAELMSDDGWPEAMEGMDAVFHLASPFPSEDVRDRASVIKPAVDGSLRVLEAARTAGVHRVIVTSSIAAVVYGHTANDSAGTRVSPFSEQDWSNLQSGHMAAYHESKTRAELAVWDYVMRYPEMQITTINPGAVFGPVIGDDVGTSAGIVRGLFNGDFAGLPRIGFEGVDVRDVAELHERALGNDLSIGNRYLCTAGFVWLRDIADMLRKEFVSHAARIPLRHLPDLVVRLAALVDRKASLAVPELGLYTPCSTARASHDLAWKPRPAMEAVRATAVSLIAAGLVAEELAMT